MWMSVLTWALHLPCEQTKRSVQYKTHSLSRFNKGLCLCSAASDFATWWTVTCQAPLSMGFSRQEHWNVLPFSSPGDLPNPEMEPVSPALLGRFFTTELPGKPHSTTALVPKPGSPLKPSVELYEALLLRPRPRDSALTGIKYCVGQTAAP